MASRAQSFTKKSIFMKDALEEEIAAMNDTGNKIIVVLRSVWSKREEKLCMHVVKEFFLEVTHTCETALFSFL